LPLLRLEVRYAGWDLGLVHLVDERTGSVLARLNPQDKTRNASGLRRSLEPLSSAAPEPAPPAPAIPPLLARLLTRQAAAGLPPPYLPMDEAPNQTESDEGDEP
jgi:hypothetical protein